MFVSSQVQRRPDSQQLVRQWAILRLLAEATEPFGIKQLAQQLGVSKATIERDLATLERDFAVVEEAAGKQKKTYRIDKKVRALESVTFGVSELLAIYAARSMLTSLAGTPLHDDLDAVMLKIRGFLGPRQNGAIEALSRVFVPHARAYVDYAPQRELIDELLDAIARRRLCRVSYHAAWNGTTRSHLLKPLKLVWHRSSLYLLAVAGTRTEITTFAVHRIRHLELTDDRFATPRINIEAHVAKAFGIFVNDDEEDVEVLFDAEIAWLVEERNHHPNELKTRLPDGRLRYCLRSSAQWEIIPWVQSFGALAELVAPLRWRETLGENLHAMAARYRD